MTGDAALYRLYSADGTLLYVGVAGDVKQRMVGHKSKSPWFRDVRKVTITWYGWREDALDAEAWAIFRESPAHNMKGSRRRIADTGRARVVKVMRGSTGQKMVAEWMGQAGVTVHRLARRMSVWPPRAHMAVFDPMERHRKALAYVTGLPVADERAWL